MVLRLRRLAPSSSAVRIGFRLPRRGEEREPLPLTDEHAKDLRGRLAQELQPARPGAIVQKRVAQAQVEQLAAIGLEPAVDGILGIRPGR